jgi:hypothetical protein
MKLQKYIYIVSAVIVGAAAFGAVLLSGPLSRPAYAACSIDASKPCTGDVPKNTFDPALKCQNGSGNDCSLLDKYLQPVIFFLGGGVGVAAAISYALAGIQYGSSADDPSKVTKAKERIFNTTIALLGFMFLWAFLEYLIPGGLFNK